MREVNAASLVAAGLLSVVIFPARLGRWQRGRLRRRGPTVAVAGAEATAIAEPPRSEQRRGRRSLGGSRTLGVFRVWGAARRPSRGRRDRA